MENLIKYLENALNVRVGPCQTKGFQYTCDIQQITQNGLSDYFEITKVTKYTNINFTKKFYLEMLDAYDKLTENNLLKPNKDKKTILIDYSSPNIAKDMHVGHLRSTIIGDTLANMYEYDGNTVLRINHMGDFGLPFGILIQYIFQNNLEAELDGLHLQTLYTESKKLFDQKDNIEFQLLSRQRTFELQTKSNEQVVSLWNRICTISKKSYNEIYKKLNVTLTEVGESFYYPFIQPMLDELIGNENVANDNGWRYITTAGDQKYTLVKSDGGYTYDTTDIVALKYRSNEIKADKILYVVDSGQSLHFQQLFEVGKKMNWLNNSYVEHIKFGVIKGIDGKRIRSRAGDTPKLMDLLEDSYEKTKEVLLEKGEFTENEIENLAFGSIKYFDLSYARTSDYVFSFDKMLQFKGNTLLYIMYSYVRCISIFNKINDQMKSVQNFDSIKRTEEITDDDQYLCAHIFKFPEIVSVTLSKHAPHYLTSYMHELSDILNSSYKKIRCLYFDENEKLIEINTKRLQIIKLLKNIYLACFKFIGVSPLDHL